MHRALLELTIDGVETSRDFHLRMMENDDFRRGAIDIQWLEKHMAALASVAPPAEGVTRAAIAAVLLAERDRSAPRRAADGATPPDRDGASDAWRRLARLEALR
jgi:acetyl-CoA carboxylase biotin carboxylase subunit